MGQKMNVDALVAIDIHTHAETSTRVLPDEAEKEALEASGQMGVREARRLIKDYGVKGFKFHPIIQGFFPNDPQAYPLYEVIAEAKLPAIFHTGQTGIGAGMRGGGGLRIKYANPVILPDRWIAEFEKLPIKPEVRPLIMRENAAKLLGLQEKRT